MGILQSVIQYLNDDSDLDEEDGISSRINAYELNSHAKPKCILVTSPSRQWQKTNCPTRSHQNTFLLRPPLETGADEEKIAISKPLTFPHQCQRGNRSTGSDQMKYVASRPREEIPARMAAEDRWIKHYSSRHWILLVGEGDFSFSASLAKAFGSASNMVATSLDSQEFLLKNYKNALSNLLNLKIRKCILMHEINATEMASHPLLGKVKFDRIIFNFPFAGFFKDLPCEAQLRRHRRLVSLFLKNAKELMSENGEIHISHKTNGNFHAQFKVESIASSHGLRLIEAVQFERSDYPGYNTKYGFGGDDNFNCVPSNTFKFALKTVPL